LVSGAVQAQTPLPYILPLTNTVGVGCMATVGWPESWRAGIPGPDSLVISGVDCSRGIVRQFGVLADSDLVLACNYTEGMNVAQCAAAGEGSQPASRYRVQTPPPPPPIPTPTTRAAPACWPFPFGSGSRWYVSYTAMNSPAAVVWYCDGKPVGVAGVPDSGVARLVSIVDPASAQAAWDDTPWRPMTTAERVIYKALVDRTKPAPVVWTVAAVSPGNDRPVYACNATCLTSRNRGASVGRAVELVAICEGPLVPPWLSGTSGAQWQFTTATNGQRGVAVCSQGP
jgi:hypothetical protein